jgi:hypothetical protein
MESNGERRSLAFKKEKNRKRSHRVMATREKLEVICRQ